MMSSEPPPVSCLLLLLLHFQDIIQRARRVSCPSDLHNMHAAIRLVARPSTTSDAAIVERTVLAGRPEARARQSGNHAAAASPARASAAQTARTPALSLNAAETASAVLEVEEHCRSVGGNDRVVMVIPTAEEWQGYTASQALGSKESSTEHWSAVGVLPTADDVHECAFEQQQEQQQKQQGGMNEAAMANIAGTSSSVGGGGSGRGLTSRGEHGGGVSKEEQLLCNTGEQQTATGNDQDNPEEALGIAEVEGLANGLEDAAVLEWAEPRGHECVEMIESCSGVLGEGFTAEGSAASGQNSESGQLACVSSSASGPAMSAPPLGNEEEQEHWEEQQAVPQAGQVETWEEEQVVVVGGGGSQQASTREQHQVEHWGVERHDKGFEGVQQDQDEEPQLYNEQDEQQQYLDGGEQQQDEGREEKQPQAEGQWQHAVEDMQQSERKERHDNFEGHQDNDQLQRLPAGERGEQLLAGMQQEPLQQQQPAKGKVKMIAASLEGRMSPSAIPPMIGGSLAKRSGSSTDSASMVSPRTFARPLMCPHPLGPQQGGPSL
jgi:hypothetical protein